MAWLSRWKPRHLVAAWVAWWLAVPLVALSRAIIAIQRATSDASNRSSVSVNAGTDGFALTVVDHGTTVWTNSASVLATTLVLAVPPLLLWAAWLRARPRGARLSASDPALLTPPMDEPRYSERKSADLDHRAPGA